MLYAAVRVAALTAAASAAAVPRDHGFNGGCQSYRNLPIATRIFDLGGTDRTCSQAQLLEYASSGNTPFDPLYQTCSPSHYAHSRNDKHFHELDFTNDPVRDPLGTKLYYNNLYGQGPNNGCGANGNGLRSEPGTWLPSAALACSEGIHFARVPCRTLMGGPCLLFRECRSVGRQSRRQL